MRAVRTILQREFLGYFRTPIAYVFLIVFVLLAVGLPWFADNFLQSDEASLQAFFRYLPWLNVLFVPAVGMRLWAEEKNSGTWELLLTMPFTTFQTVLGKFLAGWLFVGTALALTFPFPLTVAYLGHPDWGPIAGGYALGLLMAGSVLALCSFVSALTRNQVIAFILGVLVCLILNLSGWSVFDSLLRDLPPAMADAISNFSFATHFESGRQGLLRLSDVVFFAATAAAALLANTVVLERRMEAGAKSFARPFAAIALLAASAVFLSDGASRLPPLQIDLTQERFFTLSEDSAQVLAAIKRPVEVELYFSASRPGVPIGLKNFAQRVEQLLRQYARASHGKVSVRVVDPIPGSPEEEECRRLGLESRPVGQDERLYFGLAVIQAGSRRAIPLIDFRRERLLEYDVFRLIASVQEHRLPKLAVVSSLEVFGQRGMPERLRKVEDGTAEWQFLKDLRVSYDVEEVAPAAAALPAGADCLLVVNPSGFDPRLLYSIDQWVLSGRPAVVLLDPYSYHEAVRQETSGMVIGAEYHTSGDLPGLLPGWGVHFSPSVVVGDLDYATQVPLAKDQTPVRFPLWLSVASFDDAQPITAGFDRVLLAYAGVLSPIAGAPVSFTPFLRTSERSGLLPASLIGRIDPRRVGESIHPTGASYTLGALVEGRFVTAFPQGEPPPPPGQKPSTEADPWNLGLKASSGTSRVILLSDADFLENALAYRWVGRSGDVLITKPRNDNAALLVNSLDYLRGSLANRPPQAKAEAIRPFTRIHLMERDEEAAFREQAAAINARLDQLAAQMGALNRQAAEGGGSLVSEKALTALRRAQREQTSLQARRAEGAERLRRRIDSLNRRLIVLNFAAVPGLVACLGLAFWRWRMPRRGRP